VAHIPQDINRFAQLTTGHVVIMGLGTWESLPGKQRPLKNRTNIVLSTNTSLKLPGALVYHSLNSAIADYNDKDIWIIGGGKVLKQAMSIAEEIRLTYILNSLSGDCRSPEIKEDEWLEVSRSEILSSGNLRYRYIDYRRRK
jgi:dihydrofolate reductase